MSPKGKRGERGQHEIRVVPRPDGVADDLAVREVAGRHMHAHELPAPHVGRVGGDVRARGVAVELAAEDVRGRIVVRPGRMRPVPGPRIRARHDPGPHDPVDAAARHDDTLMFQGVLDLPGPVHPAAVAPHASHILLMGVDALGLGVSEHPVVVRLGNAQDPTLR